MYSLSSSGFSLNSDNTDFSERQKALFNKLSEAEKGHQKSGTLLHTASVTEKEIISKSIGKCTKRTLAHLYQGHESIFKRPMDPPLNARHRNIPDFRRNPERWTRYDLGTVPPDQMTDRSNTSAALTFLEELKQRRNADNIKKDNVDQSAPQIFKFKRPKRESEQCFEKTAQKEVNKTVSQGPINSTKITEPGQSSYRNGKYSMPEYVVGCMRSSKRKKGSSIIGDKNINSDKIKLDHLTTVDDAEV